MLLKATSEIAGNTKDGTGSTTALAKKKTKTKQCKRHYKKLKQTCTFKELKKMSPDSKLECQFIADLT